jgi:uncharacterized membrane protein
MARFICVMCAAALFPVLEVAALAAEPETPPQPEASAPAPPAPAPAASPPPPAGPREEDPPLSASLKDAPPAEPIPTKSAGFRIARFANIFLTGAQTGWFVGTKLWVSPVREDMTFPEYANYQSGVNATAGPVQPILMTATALSNIPPLVLDGSFRRYKEPAFILTSVGLVLNIAVIVTTLVGNVPVNDQTEGWTPQQTPPANWMALREQWETAHTVRSIFSTGAFLTNLAAVVIE